MLSILLYLRLVFIIIVRCLVFANSRRVREGQLKRKKALQIETLACGCACVCVCGRRGKGYGAEERLMGVSFWRE